MCRVQGFNDTSARDSVEDCYTVLMRLTCRLSAFVHWVYYCE